MSTGDQSQYIRSKLAERGSRTGAKFMEDGFDRWAESEAPAREGQMEKIPAEHKMESYGGAMSLKLARHKLGMDMQAVGLGRHRLRMDDAMDMHGGDLLSDAKAVVEQAVGKAKQVREFWQKASAWVDFLEENLKDEILDAPKYADNKGLLDTTKGLLTILNGIKGYKGVIDKLAEGMQAVGLGRHRRLHGGVAWQDAAEVAKKVVAWFSWFAKAAKNLRVLLKLKSLQPYGQMALDALDPILGAVGLGRHGMGGKRHCQCHHGGSELEDSEYSDSMMGGRRHGGASLRPGHTKLQTHMKINEEEYARALAEKQAQRSAEAAEHDRLMEQKLGGRRRRVGGRAPSARGEIVKKVMREQGLSLPQASSYVKQHGLY